jgi:hypothetical protein
MVSKFIFAAESRGWRELGALGGLTTFRHYRSVDNFAYRPNSQGAAESLWQLLFCPARARSSPTFHPTACAVGCILAPLCGFSK